MRELLATLALAFALLGCGGGDDGTIESASDARPIALREAKKTCGGALNVRITKCEAANDPGQWSCNYARSGRGGGGGLVFVNPDGTTFILAGLCPS